MLRRTTAALALCLLASSIGHATVDHLARAYQVIADPAGEGTITVPVHFLTWTSSPETEVEFIGRANSMEQRENLRNESENANLVWSFGLRVRVAQHDRDLTVISIDVSEFGKPPDCPYDVTEDQVMARTVEAIARTLEGLVTTEAYVVIRADDAVAAERWERYEKRLDLTVKTERANPRVQSDAAIE